MSDYDAFTVGHIICLRRTVGEIASKRLAFNVLGDKVLDGMLLEELQKAANPGIVST